MLRVFSWRNQICRTLFVTLILSFSGLSQNSENTIYARGLRSCLEKEVGDYVKIANRDLLNVVVLRNDELTRSLPSQLGEININYLSMDDLALRYKTHRPRGNNERSELPVIKIFPLYDENGKLYFAYNNYWFSYSESGGFFTTKKRVFTLALEGGCHAQIGVDDALGKFTIKNVELWGI